MRTRFYEIPGLMIALSSLLCRPVNGNPADYPHAYKDLMAAGLARMRQLTTRPLPPKSAPKEQKRAAVAMQSEDIAKEYQDCAHKLNALKPPAAFREVHTTTLAMLKTGAEDYHRLAQVVRHGDRQTRARVMQENEARELKALLRMQEALRKAGGTSKELQSVISDLQRSTKSP